MPHTEAILACLNNFYPTCSVEESPVHGCGEERLQGMNACCPRGSKEHTWLSWKRRGSNVEKHICQWEITWSIALFKYSNCMGGFFVAFICLAMRSALCSNYTFHFLAE